MLPPKEFQRIFTAGVQAGQYPSRLYKYRGFDPNTESIFKDHSLWFADFKTFNDPFDCQIQDPGGYTRDEIIRYLMSRGSLDAANAEQIADAQIQSPGFFPKLLEKVKQLVLGNKGILSLSTEPDNILMWSHYAASHSGFVLGFDVLKDIQFFNAPIRVHYNANYPTFRYLLQIDKIAEIGLGTKSDLWGYEGEIRIIKDTQGLHTFDPSCLAEVVLGCGMKSPEKDSLLRFLNTYGYAHVMVKQAKPSRTSYKLELV